MMLGCFQPFLGDTDAEVTQNIIEGNVVFDEDRWSTINDDATDFCQKCLTVDPEERPSIEDLFEHPWIQRWIEEPILKGETREQLSASLKSFAS